MSSYESVPTSISYEKLLQVLQERTTVDKPYDQRLYLVELTNSLWERVREVRTVGDNRRLERDQ
jgi:hypothetical protein